VRSHARAASAASSRRRGGGLALVSLFAFLALTSATPAAAAGPPEHTPLPSLSHSGLAVTCNGVATDPNGDLYLAENSAKKISVYAPDGSPITSFTLATTDLNGGGPCQLAVDSSGRIYVTNSNRKEVFRYAPSAYPPTASTTYSLDTSLNGNGRLAVSPAAAGGTNSVAVDPATEDAYVTEVAGNEIQEFAKPAESYALRFNSEETGSIAAAASCAEVQTAMQAKFGAANVAVANGFPATTRCKITFKGALASTDVGAVELVKGGCSPGTDCEKAFEMFKGSATPHVSSFQPDGTPVSSTIGAGVAGASYFGVAVYGKNGNVYVTDKAHSKVIVFNPAGNTVLVEFDGSDSPAGAFQFSTSFPNVAVDQSNGHAYVSDISAHHVVDEFDGAGSFVAQLSHTPPFEEGALPDGIAVDNGATSPSKGTVYLTAFTESEAQAGVFAFGPLIYGLPLKVVKLGQGHGTVTSSPVGIDCGPTCEAEFEKGGLVTLAAQPSLGSGFGVWSGCDEVNPADECEVTLNAAREVSVRFDSRPLVSQEEASQITASSAHLQAQVNPMGKATAYRFEYIAKAAWQANGESFSGSQAATRAPQEPVAIGSGTLPVPVGVRIEGLGASTTYLFRAIAENEVGAVEGERDPGTDAEITHSFTTFSPPDTFPNDNCTNGVPRSGPSAQLPDCRAFEQASPVDKDGGNLQGTLRFEMASEDGGAISFQSSTGVPGGSGSQNFPTYVALRGADGWSTKGLLPDPSSGQGAKVLGWTPDFTTVFDQAELFSEGVSLLGRSTADGDQTEIFPHTQPNPQFRYLGSSSDGAVSAFEATSKQAGTGLQLTPDSAPGEPNVYVSDHSHPGAPRLAGVLPDGSTPPLGSQASGGMNGGQNGGSYDYATHVVSADGSVFFNDLDDGRLYRRLNPTAEETSETDGKGNCVPDPVLACTVPVSASRKENGRGPGGRDAAGSQPASFVSASRDGTVTTFTSSEKLTDDATTGPEPAEPAIDQAKLADGSGKEVFSPAFAGQIDVDPVQEYVYWTDPSHDRIGRAKLDGSVVEEDFLTGLPDLEGVTVVDQPGSAEYVFWTTAGAGEAQEEPPNSESEAIVSGLGKIGRAGLDGSGIEPNCLAGLTNPHSTDANSSHIYWNSPNRTNNGRLSGDGEVHSAAFNCDQSSVVAIAPPPGGALIKGGGDLAVDDSHLYLSFVSLPNAFVNLYNLDGSAIETGIVGIANAKIPPGLAVDGAHLYWTVPVNNRIGRSDLLGSDPSEEPNFITEAGAPTDLALDASHIFWGSNQNVTANPGRDIYQWKLSQGASELTDLAPDTGDPNGVEVQGVLGSSEDGSYVYFAANGVPDGIGNSPNQMGESATTGNCGGAGKSASGTCNLYVYHAGSVDFIARLDAAGPGDEADAGDAVDWIASLLEIDATATKSARVSEDGRILVFRSSRELSGYDNQGPNCLNKFNTGERAPGPCLEFYRFDYATMALTCLTCNPTGAAPAGPAWLASIRPPVGGGPPPAAMLGRNLSGDGNRFFFETKDALVAQDTNGENGCPEQGVTVHVAFARPCQDVYEWEAPGRGSCTENSPAYSTLDAGCIYLISTGKSDRASYFGDADREGDNVFVFTYQPLVGQDKDALLDVYDARVNGGLASQNQPEAPACSGEACKAPPASAPAGQAAGSAAFAGPGNATPGRPHKKKHRKHRKHRHGRHRRGHGAKHTGKAVRREADKREGGSR
jgi:hypothetical protein